MQPSVRPGSQALLSTAESPCGSRPVAPAKASAGGSAKGAPAHGRCNQVAKSLEPAGVLHLHVKPVASERFLKNQEQASLVRLPKGFGEIMCAACVLQHTTEPGASCSSSVRSGAPVVGCRLPTSQPSASSASPARPGAARQVVSRKTWEPRMMLMFPSSLLPNPSCTACVGYAELQ